MKVQEDKLQQKYALFEMYHDKYIEGDGININ